MKILKRTLLCFLSLLFLALIYSFIEPFCLTVKEVTITDKDIPKSYDNAKIVFVSDIHHGPFFSKDRVKNLVEKINEQNPDIILLGGDYVHRNSKYIEPCFEELKNLKAKIGKYAVLGNHDHWEGAEQTIKAMNNAGIEDMDNQALWVRNGDDSIKIGGVGDLNEDIQNLDITVRDAKETDFVILLSHNPDFAEKISTNKIDLVLSGHTHGGQITLFGGWAPIMPSIYGQKYKSGMVETNNTKVFVTNGVGTITPPVRFFARPEIVVFNLVRGK